ncbi:hypothetical protein [Comamonas thiooxydans]|uniref:hypothetical protein n=1 Tax=Comamonas thiooxydans TaxID=363952 RepID=UPI001A95442A|nr:hypothetical protein [Comamonas thiooxydans]
MMNQDTTPSHARRLLPRFPLGLLHATPGASAVLDGHPDIITTMLARHSFGNWGDLCDDDKQTNDMALQHGGRIFSVYIELDTKFYVITEADRSSTCILLPSEY